jgi:hypothetical protein
MQSIEFHYIKLKYNTAFMQNNKKANFAYKISTVRELAIKNVIDYFLGIHYIFLRLLR